MFLASAQERQKELTVDDIYGSAKFFPRGIRGVQWIQGGKAYSYLETDTSKKQTDVWTYDVKSGKKTRFLDASKLVLKEGGKPLAIQNYSWSPDESNVLFTGTLTARSMKSGGNFFLYDLTSSKFKQLTDTDEEQMNVKFSPSGAMIGFVRASNLFVMDLGSGKETQLTFDGAEHVAVVSNGHCGHPVLPGLGKEVAEANSAVQKRILGMKMEMYKVRLVHGVLK